MLELDLPSTKSEHSNESFLLAPANLKASNDRKGEEQDGHILSNVQSGCGEPDDVLIHTAAAPKRLVPEVADRLANKNITNDAPCAASNDYAQHSIASPTKVADWEDPNVLDKY